MQQSEIIERLIQLNEKELKDPINKSIFSDDDLYVEIWKNGELEAYKINKKLEIQAAYAGATRIYKKKYEESRSRFLRDKNEVDKSKKIDFLDLPELNIPTGYKFDINGGIMKFNESEMAFESVFPQVVIIEERYINIDTDEEKNKITFIDRLKKKSLIVDAETVSSASSIIKLRNLGIMVTSENAKALVAFLSEFLSVNMYAIEPKKSISRAGWNKCEFIPYDNSCIFDGELENKHLFESISCSGDYDEWVDYVRELRKQKNLRFQMAASFASPLIELTGLLPFVFHLWGGTGSGKTVGLMVAMSIWGNPAMGKMVRTMNMTQNSMMTTAAFLYSLPFAGDELQIIKNKWNGYDNLIMAITEGVDRGRMDGHVNRRLKNWNCNFLFTGEEPCTTFSSGGGTKNRVIEIECTEPVVLNGNEAVNFVKANYGLAGEKYIRSISEYDIQKEFEKIFKEFVEAAGSTEKQAMSLALMLLADKIACEQIFGEMPLQAKDVAHLLKSSNDVDVSERAFSYIMDWISINQSCFSSEKETLSTNSKIYGRMNRHDENIVYVVNSMLKDELHSAGFSLEAVIGKWREKGYSIPNSQGKNIHSTRINGVKSTCYKLDLSSFRTDEDIEIEQSFENQAELIEF